MTQPKSQNLTWSASRVSRDRREQVAGQRGCVLWLTGLSGSGKSTIAQAIEVALLNRGRLAQCLDGDNLRHGLNADLGFSPDDRQENIRRVGEVAALIAEGGLIVATAFISPYRADRDRAAAATERLLGPGRFLEVYLDVPVEECEARDPKGLYQKARSGEIKDFTGISAPYEAPESPALTLPTKDLSVDACVKAVLTMLEARALVPTLETTP